MIVESKKAMGGRWKECWTDCGNVKKTEGMLDSVGLWKERKEWEEDERNAE